MDKITTIYKHDPFYNQKLQEAIESQGYDDLEDMFTCKKLKCSFCEQTFKDLGNHHELSDDSIIYEDCHNDNEKLIDILNILVLEMESLKSEKIFIERRKNFEKNNCLNEMIEN
jgi:hypothetical protein